MPILINHTIYGKDKRCELISNSIFVSKNRKNRSYSIILEFGSKYEARIQRIFREFDIKTIRDLCQWPGKDLVRVRDMGRKSIEEIEDVLERYNLRLGMLGKELDEYAGIENSVQDEEEEAKWEQRRYEIAKEVFIHHRLVANSAVYEADGLIRALRGMTHR